MPSKYYKPMSEINASEELKTKIKASMEEEKIKENNKKTNGGIIMKTKKTVAAITATITALLCGGLAFATIVGSAPANDESMGIKFSENYSEYEEILENAPYLEKNGAKITLESTVADSGFIVLKFNVKLNEEQSKEAEEKGGLYYLSFNDDRERDSEGLPSLAGANYNLIIDGKDYWIRPGSNQTVKNIVENKEYEVYQMWFLSNELKNKEKFTITLDKVVMIANNKANEFDGKFEVELSKEKSLENTKTIAGKGEALSYKKLNKSIKEVKITPLQNIVELSNVEKNISIENKTYLLDENYCGDPIYKVMDQDGNKLVNYNIEKTIEVEYADGTKEEGQSGELEFSKQDFKNATIKTTEYIAVEKSEQIKKIKIEVYSKNDYYETITKIGDFEIDLENKDIKTIQDKVQKTQKEYSGLNFKFLYPTNFKKAFDEAEENGYEYLEDSNKNSIMLSRTDYSENPGSVTIEDILQSEKDIEMVDGKYYRSLIKEEYVTLKNGEKGYILEFETYDNAYQVIFITIKYDVLYEMIFSINNKYEYSNYKTTIDNILDTLNID